VSSPKLIPQPSELSTESNWKDLKEEISDQLNRLLELYNTLLAIECANLQNETTSNKQVQTNSGSLGPLITISEIK